MFSFNCKRLLAPTQILSRHQDDHDHDGLLLAEFLLFGLDLSERLQ